MSKKSGIEHYTQTVLKIGDRVRHEGEEWGVDSGGVNRLWISREVMLTTTTTLPDGRVMDVQYPETITKEVKLTEIKRI